MHDGTAFCPGCNERKLNALNAHYYWRGYKNALTAQNVSSSVGLKRARDRFDRLNAEYMRERKVCRYLKEPKRG